MSRVVSTGSTTRGTGSLFLVRHGRPVIDPRTQPERWTLDPGAHADVRALRASGRLPARATWFSSPEAKAQETAALLTDGPVTVVAALAEHRRGAHWFEDPDEFRDAVRRAFASPDEPAVADWEPLDMTRGRVVPAVRRILAAEHGDVVLVGHGTAWTVLVAALTGSPPDLEAWERLAMPDLWTLQATV